MTIYTPKKTEKKEALLKEPQVVDGKVVPPPPEDVWIKPPTAATVQYQRQQRHQQRRRISCWMFICVIVSGCLLIVAGVYATIHLYKAMQTSRSSYYFACTVDAPEVAPQKGPFKENVEFDKELKQYEKITVPSLDEFEEATVLHDFEKSWTAIIDPIHERCFVSPLNKSTVAPPKDFYDLLRKLRTGYYLPNTKVLQERFRVIEPPVDDYRPFGFYIYMECFDKVTYLLQPITGPATRLEKRSVGFSTHYNAGGTTHEISIEL